MTVLSQQLTDVSALRQHVDEAFQQHGIDPDHHQAAVVAAFRNTLSTELGPNHLWSDGTMHTILNLLVATSSLWDDDGSVPVAVFDGRVVELGDATAYTCDSVFDKRPPLLRHSIARYLPTLEWALKKAGLDHVDLNKDDPFCQQQVLATAKYPTYVLIVTSGETVENEGILRTYLRALSQVPIFVQFVGVGHGYFGVLDGLDRMRGRLIDNVNYFHINKAKGDPLRLLKLLLKEFPSYYAEARRIGLLTD